MPSLSPRVRFALAAAGLLVALPHLSADQPAAVDVAAAVRPFVDRGVVAGAVLLVADKDKVLAEAAVGYADVANKVPMTTDAVFWIASQSKPITAAALMILVDEGKVSLDDPVAKYLPEFEAVRVAGKNDGDREPLQNPAHPVTVREVLSHTSGLPFQSVVEKPTLDGLPLAAAVRSYAATPLDTQPGTKYQYSNAGINTAGRIIEVVSGVPYETFLDRRLFAPLGMTDTTFWPTAAQVKRLAKAYKPGPDKAGLVETTVTQLRYPLTDHAKRFPMPAGGLFSTAEDVAKFCQMLLNGGTLHGRRVLSADAVAAMTTKQTPPAVKDGYGLGLSVGGWGYGHGGAYSTNMTVDPKRGLVTVYMVQHSGFPGDGGKAGDAFRKAAEAEFGVGKKK